MKTDEEYKELEQKYYALRTAFSVVLERVSNGEIKEPCSDTAYLLSLLYAKGKLDEKLR